MAYFSRRVLKLIDQAAHEKRRTLNLSSYKLTEFSLAHKAWISKGIPQIFIYFNEKSHTPKSKAETDQWGRVLEFRDKFPKEGLWWPYKGKTQFEKLVRNHLTNYIRTLR